VRRAALTRRTALRAGSAMVRRTGLRRAPAVRSRPRQTGPSQDTKLAAIARDGQCVVGLLCHDHPAPELVPNHRVNRGMGGSSDPAVNQVESIIMVCRLDNGWLEDHPERAYAAGWKVRRGVDPGRVPVRYPDGFRWLLDGRGGRSLADGGSSVVEMALLVAFAAALTLAVGGLLDLVLSAATAGR